MGNIIPLKDLNESIISETLKPIVFCKFNTNVQAYSLNRELATELMKIAPQRRSFYLKQVFQKVIGQLPPKPLIKDYDVLFNPNYKVNVLEMMIAVCKVKPFNIIWAGKYKDEKLIYAEEGLQDYKTYNIKDYDITCIV